jgi:hypothetical protein
MLGTEERRRLDIGEGSNVRYCKTLVRVAVSGIVRH